MRGLGDTGRRGYLDSVSRMAETYPVPQTVEVAGAVLRYRTWGPEHGRPVLYLHHLGVSGGSLHPHETASGLAASGYRVVAFDQPGFGGSPALKPEAYPLDALAGLAVGMLDALGI